MTSVIYNPLKEYESRLKALHLKNTEDFFEELVKKSGVNIEENRAVVEEYNTLRDNLAQIKKKFNLLRFLRVLMIITVILIPLVILKTTPKIQKLRADIALVSEKVDELFALANKQMLPLCRLFTENDGIGIIETTVPLMKFDDFFSAEREADMVTNFDFDDRGDDEQSTLEVLSGKYNENPFLFENRLIHKMGEETYHGYKTITWTETYRDSNGKLQRRTRSQTLHASVTKPKPFYSTQVVLNYGAQGGPELSFSRDASHLEQKSEKSIERIVKRGEKKLKKLTDKATTGDGNFTSMSNSNFEVLFDALDRTNELQFRTLFTPLAQTNMVELILSKNQYGDDFNFIKKRRMNEIISNHSQERALKISPECYKSYSFDMIKESFTACNAEYFKAVYFDFAPLLAIPVYQERPVHSLKPIPDMSRLYSGRECEALANAANGRNLVHPNTKTQAILKSGFVRSVGDTDETRITAYSYDIIGRVDVVAVYGGDGRYHDVSVPWDDYIPLQKSSNVFVGKRGSAGGRNVIANKNSLCIFG